MSVIRATPLMRAALLEAARAIAKARGVPIRAISRLAYGDSVFFRRVARGKPFTTVKYDQAMEWMSDPKNWPDETVPPQVVDLFAALKNKEPA